MALMTGGAGGDALAVARARLLYERINTDPLSVPELCAADVRLALSPDLPFGGRHEGRAGVRECMRGVVDALPGIRVMPRTYLTEGPRVVVLGFAHLGHAGNSVGFAHVCEFTAGPECLLRRFSDRTNPYRILAGMSRQLPVAGTGGPALGRPDRDEQRGRHR